MTWLLYALGAWMVLSLVLLAWLGYRYFRPPTHGAPVPNDGEIDEYLDAEFRPFIPPQYIPAGMNPTAAVRARTRADGKIYHSRRISGAP